MVLLTFMVGLPVISEGAGEQLHPVTLSSLRTSHNLLRVSTWAKLGFIVDEEKNSRHSQFETELEILFKIF